MESIEDIKRRVRQAQRKYSTNLRFIGETLAVERGYVQAVPENKNVVLLMSGGLDSSVMAGKVIEDFGVRVYPLFIRRGARAEPYEEEAFDHFCDFYQRRFPNNFFEGKKIECRIPPREIKSQLPPNLALTIGHPLRNSTMQNLAVMYAVSLQSHGIDTKTIWTGSVAEDNTEPELGLLSLRAQTLSTCISMGDWEWNITAPLIDPQFTNEPVGKRDLIQYAVQKFIPLQYTRTCFSSDEIPDGTCNACRKRQAAFDYLGIKDPLIAHLKKLFPEEYPTKLVRQRKK